MAWNDYEELIDFGKLRVMAARKGMSMGALGRYMGISDSHCRNIIRGRFIPDTETLAKMCGALECSVDDLVTFKDIEFKDFYKGKDPFIPHKPDDTALYRTSFEPLRQLLLSVYGEELYQDKFNELLSKVKPVGGSEAQVRHAAELQEKRDLSNSKGRHSGGYIKGELNTSIKSKFKHDRPVNMRLVYNLCKVLGCTPAWVLTYK